MAKTNTQRKQKPAQMKPAGLPQRQVVQVGRNEVCPCGSGKKYKHCHASEGQEFLAKLAQQKERAQTLERMKAEGAPWYKRLFASAS